MGKEIQITNTIILGLIASILSLFIIMILLMSFTTGQFQGIFNFSSGIYFLIWITSVIYFIFLIMSFKKCDIENKSFKWAFWLNVIWISLAIILFLGLMFYISTSKPTTLTESFDAIDKANKITGFANPLFGIIYFISFIVFIVSYFKNKKGSQSFSSP